ncbi:4-hydroxybenzoate octaprenyltransferase [Biformimicrobium ophioploci]|uniref:4-hydroxybenzoate octaprenyltransferase n=1 Tax=Biformimicrobium ophioploci TaxID=3036711 RepID=A0ABQ6LVJ0_9GAMM|nr:4-hydroxybenzoate octaprenyltransferase [Microbulbifer sp. NKW57]GMG86099.1 4-hydroxybenzoate octaprenyltransferase [Microbulbifer sp. NKW57]
MITQQISRRWPQLVPFWQLMRMDRPIGTLLLLWPTWWALWLAEGGLPSLHLFVVFTLGVILMRAAGCILNDYADRNLDGHVERTRNRPLATGAIRPRDALLLCGALLLLALLLVLTTNTLTIQLAFGAFALAATYPYMKRHTHLPQIVLGAAFSMGIVMAFAASRGTVPPEAWLLFSANLLWTTAYDTFYAMVDRDDDLKIGIRSTAILFGDMDRAMTASLQGLTLFTLYLAGTRFELSWPWYLGLLAAALLFAWQQWLVRNRERDACFQAFLNNNYVGLVIFLGILGHYLVA